jgi:hypothetical protein
VLGGADVGEVLRATFGGRTDERAPFAWSTRLRPGARNRIVKLTATVEMVDARRARVVRHLRVCALG